MPVIPATQEAEAGELPEPRRRRLRRAEIALLHFSRGDRARVHFKKKKGGAYIQSHVVTEIVLLKAFRWTFSNSDVCLV